jgi:hypothetical protein
MKKIAIGCGIAALVIIAIGIGGVIFGIRWVEGQMANAERYERILQEMESAYGLPEEFLPPVDGVYDPERIRLFARMRGELADAGADFVIETNALVPQQDQRWWKEIRGAMKILNSGAGYLATADSLLLDAGMSHGEYAHYQLLMLEAYFEDSVDAFLDSDPDAASGSEFIEAFEAMASEYETEGRRILQAHARNARDAAEQEIDCAACPEWIGYLDDQLERTRGQRRHLPLTDPLPASLEAAFENHRSQLAATRPTDYGTWLLSILMVMELDDDGEGIKFEFNTE